MRGHGEGEEEHGEDQPEVHEVDAGHLGCRLDRVVCRRKGVNCLFPFVPLVLVVSPVDWGGEN